MKMLLWLLGGAGVLWVLSRTAKGQEVTSEATAETLDFVDVTASRVVAYVKSRGYRNNNPGNIRYLSANAWNGQTGNDAGYGIYDTPQNGTRALGRQLLKYAAAGRNTVAAIINAWAPTTENNTTAYINDVCKQLGVTASQVIDVKAQLPALARAIAKHENGYIDSSYNWQWVYL